VSVQGDFEAGDAVDLYCEGEMKPFGRGLVTLSAKEATKVAGTKSWDAQKEHTEPLPSQLIHRDDMAFLG
jgi:glutamate 5-kinase